MVGFESWTTSGYETAVTVVSIMFAAAGIALGLGIGLRIRWMEDWGRDEIIQSAINGALVGGLFILFSSSGIVMMLMNGMVDVNNDFVLSTAQKMSLGSNSTALSQAVVCEDMPQPSGGITPSCYALMYLQLDASMLSGVISLLNVLVMVLAFASSINLNLIVISFTPLGGLEAYVGIFSHALEMMIMLLTMTTVQVIFIKFIDATALPVMLPVGLILRSFYMTRKLGGALMAIAIGLAVVFPMTFVLDGKMLTKNMEGPTGQLDNATNDIRASLTNMTDFSGLFTQPSSDALVPNVNQTANKTNALSNLYDGMADSVDALGDSIQNFMANMLMMVVILPFFNVIVTMVSVRELASLFGSEFGGGSFGSL